MEEWLNFENKDFGHNLIDCVTKADRVVVIKGFRTFLLRNEGYQSMV